MRHNSKTADAKSRITNYTRQSRLAAISANFIPITDMGNNINPNYMVSGQSIAIDPFVMSQQEYPEKLIHREVEYRQLLSNVRNSINTMIFGPVGTGKTALLKQTIQEVSSSKIRAIYLDCSLYKTCECWFERALNTNILQQYRILQLISSFKYQKNELNYNWKQP